ncbi:E3 ubiquitin-protein ligase SH3RF1 [Clarias gariepinus]
MRDSTSTAMDESALLDLLECPVCLERLDVTAKVLPCQHTFCRRCLLGIVGSRGELRCPECRTLVESGVDELPSNILLVRLLDGIKQRPWRAGTGCTNGSAGGGGREHANPGTQPQRAQTKSSAVRGVPQLPCAKALYNYDGKEPGDLKFGKGDIIILRRQVDENWYHGEVGGVHGFFPASFVQVIKPLPQPPPQCKALYDFELKDKEADKDCLPFSKDDILTVIRRVDQNWAEGMLGDKIGIFPISYVEFNSAARQLIELDKVPDDSAEGTSSSSSCSSGPQTNGSHKAPGEKKNSKKRHSFTSLTMSHKPCLAPPPQRHSMEISGPVLISSSNPTAAARIGELSGGLSSSAPSQVHICTTGLIVTPPPSSPVTTATVFTFPPETSYASIPVDTLPPPPPPPPQSSTVGATSSLAAGQRPSPTTGDQSGRQRPTVYIAMFPYTPRKEDELELRKGEMFLVLERCQDGWFKGTSMHTGKIGVFPGNYMSPVSRTVANSSQPKVPLAMCSQAGRGVTLVSSSPSPIGAALGGVDPNKPLPICTGPAPSSPIPATVVTAAHVPPGQHPKVLMHVTSQMTVNQARNAVRTAVCHTQDRPTAAVTPIQSQNAMAFLPHLAVCPQPSPGCISASNPTSNRLGAAMGCAATSLTPPNISAASLEVDGMRPNAMMSLPVASGNGKPHGATAANQASGCKLDKDCKREKKGLLKLLSNKKKLRPSPPSSPTLEAEQAVAADMPQGAMAPEIPVPSPTPMAGGNHCRSGPCPVEVETPAPSSSSSSSSAASASSSNSDAARRSGCQENSAPIAPPPRQPCSSLLSMQHDGRPIVCERYRVVVSYPPQSEAELELKEGDIVFVHKKREDGWFKGTLQRNGRTGLFPGSFVDSI